MLLFHSWTIDDSNARGGLVEDEFACKDSPLHRFTRWSYTGKRWCTIPYMLIIILQYHLIWNTSTCVNRILIFIVDGTVSNCAASHISSRWVCIWNDMHDHQLLSCTFCISLDVYKLIGFWYRLYHEYKVNYEFMNELCNSYNYCMHTHHWSYQKLTDLRDSFIIQ